LQSASTPEVPFCAAARMAWPSFWRVVRRPVGCARSPVRGAHQGHRRGHL